MDTNKAAYWIALGVFALALNSEYQNGRFVAVHRVAEHAGSALCRMATRAEQTLAVAKVLTSRERFPVDGLVAATDGAELLRDGVLARADVIHARAEVQRAQVEQIRLRMRSRFRLARTVNRQVM